MQRSCTACELSQTAVAATRNRKYDKKLFRIIEVPLHYKTTNVKLFPNFLKCPINIDKEPLICCDAIYCIKLQWRSMTARQGVRD